MSEPDKEVGFHPFIALRESTLLTTLYFYKPKRKHHWLIHVLYSTDNYSTLYQTVVTDANHGIVFVEL